MNESYLAVAFRKTIEQRFASQTDALKAAYEKRLQELRAENADAAKEKQRHLESQILPGIAVYSVMPKEGLSKPFTAMRSSARGKGCILFFV